MTADALGLAAAIASHDVAHPPGLPLVVSDWPELRGVLARHHLQGLAVEAATAGSLVLTETQRRELEADRRATVLRAIGLDALLASANAALAAAVVPALVLKGPAHAHLLYGRPARRPYGDLDLLVPGADFARAVEALEGTGADRTVAERALGYDARFGKGATLRHRSGLAIDLHRTLIAGPYAQLIDADGLFDGPQTFDVDGVTFQTLGRATRLLHICISIELSDPEPKLISLRDLVHAVHDPELDLEEVRVLASRWRLTAVIARAIRRTYGTLALHPLPDGLGWVSSHRTTLEERALLAVYRGTSKRWARQAVATIPYVPGWADRWRYIRTIVRPA